LKLELSPKVRADHPDPGEPLAGLGGEDLPEQGILLGLSLLLSPLDMLLLLLLSLDLQHSLLPDPLQFLV